MSNYADRIEAAQDFETLCNIIEDAADDMNITNADYCRVYNACVDAARNMGVGILRAEHYLDCAASWAGRE